MPWESGRRFPLRGNDWEGVHGGWERSKCSLIQVLVKPGVCSLQKFIKLYAHDGCIFLHLYDAPQMSLNTMG